MRKNPFEFEKKNLLNKSGVSDYQKPIKMQGYLIRPKKRAHNPPLDNECMNLADFNRAVAFRK